MTGFVSKRLEQMIAIYLLSGITVDKKLIGGNSHENIEKRGFYPGI